MRWPWRLTRASDVVLASSTPVRNRGLHASDGGRTRGPIHFRVAQSVATYQPRSAIVPCLFNPLDASTKSLISVCVNIAGHGVALTCRKADDSYRGRSRWECRGPAARRAFCCWRPNGGSRMPLSAVLRDRASPLATNEREETPAAMAAPMTREDDARAYERHAGHDMREPPALSRKV